jgi:E3 ubiquitin-protein ligase TRIP12
METSPSGEQSQDKAAAPTQPTPSTKRGKSGRRSAVQGELKRWQSKVPNTEPSADGTPSNRPSGSRKSSRKTAPKPDEDVAMEDAPEPKPEDDSQQSGTDPAHPETSDDGNGEGPPSRYDEEEDDDDDDPFGAAGFLGRHPHSLSQLRHLTGMMSSANGRLRGTLEQLKSKDPSLQLIGLQELSEVLLISTEDNLAGHFSPDAYVKELVALMQPSGFEEENPEMMLLACRCLANMMEALPASTANVVYGGAVPVLCSKLLEINFIDLAEQCLSVSMAPIP